MTDGSWSPRELDALVSTFGLQLAGAKVRTFTCNGVLDKYRQYDQSCFASVLPWTCMVHSPCAVEPDEHQKNDFATLVC